MTLSKKQLSTLLLLLVLGFLFFFRKQIQVFIFPPQLTNFEKAKLYANQTYEKLMGAVGYYFFRF